MFTIDVVVRNTALPISVDRKEAEDAEKVYQEIVSAINSGMPKTIELTCEKQEGKKVVVLTEAIAAATISQKSGTSATGRAAGFYQATES